MAPEILDTDLFVVNRDDVTYKVSAEDLNLTGPKPINPGPDQIQIDPSVPGTGTELDPFILSPVSVSFGGSGVTVEEITISGQNGGDLVLFVDENASVNGSRFSQPIGTIVDGSDYKTRLRFSDVPESSAEQTFVGKLRLAETEIYFQWAVTVEANTEAPVLNAVTLVGTGTDTSKRFADQSFHTTLDIDEGKPVSTKSIAYKVAGTLSVTPTTSEIVGEDKVTVPGGWTAASAAEANNWTSVIYADGKFVAVAYSGTKRVMYSTDGINWTAASATEANGWQSVTYGDGKFVAVADSGTNRVMYSTDGINWTAASATEANAWRGLTYGDGKFVAVSYDGTNRVMYSADGINWTAASATSASSWRSVTYADGKFVAVASDVAMYSTNGINWTAASGIENNNWYSVTYGDGKFVAVAVGGTNRVMYSTDGINWTSALATEANDWRSVTYGDGKFVAIAYNGTNRVMWSTDAINWTAASAAEANNWLGVTYGGGKFVAVAHTGTNRVMWSEYGNDPYESQTLTLADNKDLDKFTVGELVQQNAPVVETNSSVFSATTYPGNSGLQEITTDIDNRGDYLLWFKCRNQVNQENLLYDSKRRFNWSLQTDGTSKETDSYQPIVSLDEDGVTIDSPQQALNFSGYNYIVWNFRGAPGFFDIQTWTGTDGAPRVLPHALKATPGFIITKCSSNAGTEWFIYHKEMGTNRYLKFDSTTSSASTNAWSSITDTTFGFGTGQNLNAAGREYVAYLFADNPGTIDCGKYIGTSSNTIDCGFQTAFVMIKSTDNPSHWCTFDHIRGNEQLRPDNNVPGNTESGFSFTSSGFQLSDSSSQFNMAGKNYIYIAIARSAVADIPVTPAGLFESYDDTTDPAAPTMTLTPQVDGWSANTGNYAVGETNTSNNATLYLETNNSRQVTGTTASPVYYDTTATTDEITFDLAPGTGQSWDDELPDGTTIEACAHADNTAGGGGRSPLTGDICSDKLQPEVDNPYGPALLGLTTLYPGTGAAQTITNGINLADKGGLVWTKARTEAYSHALYDTLRGPQNVLQSQTTTGQQTFNGNGLSAFNDDGFDIGGNQSWSNAADKEYVAWTFQKASGYFDIQTWTGGSTGGSGGDFTLPHSLGAEVGFVIVKNLSSSTEYWQCYHKELGTTNTQGLYLNETDGVGTTTRGVNPVKSTSTTEIEIRGEYNVTGSDYIAYLFADTLGTIKCGSYLGNGTIGKEVDCGFKPQWVLLKAAATANPGWVLVDNKRPGNTDGSHALYPNSADAEETWVERVKFTDTGFALNNTQNTENGAGATYVYVAIAEPVIRNLTQEEVNATKLLFETKDYRQAKYEQDLVSRASSLRANFEARGFTTAEIDAVLNPDVTPEPETPVAISGYYPLYTTESASNAAGDGTSHTHEFDGVTYYMPNGVTFYHGDYGSGY